MLNWFTGYMIGCLAMAVVLSSFDLEKEHRPAAVLATFAWPLVIVVAAGEVINQQDRTP
jgi:hypothetical protein